MQQNNGCIFWVTYYLIRHYNYISFNFYNNLMRLILWLSFYEKNKVHRDLMISGMPQDLHSKASVLLIVPQDNEN